MIHRSQTFSRAAATLCGLLGMLVSIAPSGQAQKPDPLSHWEHFDFAKNEITSDQLKGLSALQLKYLRGIVFGRHGRVFQEEAIQKWLTTRPWYKPDPAYRVAVLNTVERHNMDAIKEAEWRQHKTAQPGDMKFYRNRLLSDGDINTEGQQALSTIELTIMQGEIEAIHGKRFDDMPWLQKFFEERYWYHPVAHYNAGELNNFERQNLALLTKALKNKRSVAVLPGDMGLFEETPITPELLKGLDLYSLRLLRNEVYARRGKRFHTLWLQRHFATYDWYKPFADFRDPNLTPVDLKNVALIVQQERHLHDALSTEPLQQDVVSGLFVEDVRKLRDEILARRGMIFKDKWRDSYFRSFSWYKPDPKFSLASLNAIEKQNLATLTVLEKKAQRQADFTPA